MWVLQDGSFYFSSSLLFFCGKCVCLTLSVCIVVCHEETAGQRELVYHQRFFNLSYYLVLKARQLSHAFFFFWFFFTAFALGFLVFLTFTGPFGLFNFCGNF